MTLPLATKFSPSKYLAPFVLLSILGCTSNVKNEKHTTERDAAPSNPPANLDKVPDAVPRVVRPNPAKQRAYRVAGRTYYPLSNSKGFVQRGMASWYGKKFHGRTTANGERYNMYAMTAAHKRLPLPSYAQVTNLENGRSVVVRVNDRGPFHGNRVIDLSYAAAHKLGFVNKGVTLVEVRAIDPNNPAAGKRPKPLPASTRIFVQAGSFSQTQNARALQAQLQQGLQRPVFTEAVQTSAGLVNRVLVGPLDSHRVAEYITRQLLDLAIQDAKLILR